MTKTRFHALIVSTMLFLLALPGVAAKPGGGGSTTPTVTSTIHYSPVSGSPYLLRGDALPSATYIHGVDSIVSQLPDYYELSALASANRRMFVDFGQPVEPGTEVPAGALDGATSGFVKGRFISKDGGIAAMKGVGSTLVGALPFVFTGSDGKNYQVRMNAVNEPGTDDALFTCTHVAGSNQADPLAPCDAWRAVPNGAGGMNVGRLVKNESIRGKQELTYYGDFYMTFEVTFTKP